MRDIVLRVIKTIIERKKRGKTAPFHASYSEVKREILKDVDGCMEELEKEGKMKIGQEINDKYINLNDE